MFCMTQLFINNILYFFLFLKLKDIYFIERFHDKITFDRLNLLIFNPSSWSAEF